MMMQEGEAERAVERAAIVAELNLSLAHAAALLGRWDKATVAVKAGRKALSGAKGAAGSLFKETNRQELSRELDRVQTFVVAHHGQVSEPIRITHPLRGQRLHT